MLKFTEDTTYLELGDDKKYCAYCGKEIPADVHLDDYDRTEFYHCDCETAVEELKMKWAIKELQSELSQKQYELRTFIRVKRNYVTKTVLQKLQK